jgi:hypothetical protein
MSVDLTKYDKCTFHENELANKRIKVLLLYFDNEVDENNNPIEHQIIFIDNWIETFIQEQHYELISVLKKKRFDIINNTNTVINDNLSEPTASVSFLTKLCKKINKLLKNKVL